MSVKQELAHAIEAPPSGMAGQGPAPLKLPLGTSEFSKYREPGVYYADKTWLIRDLLDVPEDAILFPRPRRFGKTTNLSMLRTFFGRQKEDLSPLFEGLAIWQAGPAYRAHLGRYPVVSLSFKDVKADSWDDCRAAIFEELAAAFREHRDLLGQGVLYPDEAAPFDALLNRRATLVEAWSALKLLTAILHRVHGEPVLVLVDEYDTPLLSGFHHGYLDEVSGFFRNLLSGGLKDNTHLFKGVLTGVLRVAKENLFSGLNNIITYGITRERFATAFGFTEGEVQDLLARIGRPEAMDEVSAWYNGYNFGGQVIYNPWSVLSYASDPRAGFQPYWVQTSANDVLRDLVLRRHFYVFPEFKQLLESQPIEKPISDHVTLRELYDSPTGIWSLLLHAGYLKLRQTRYDPQEVRTYAELCIPNQEVRHVFVESVLSWVASGEQDTQPLDQLLTAMLKGDTRTFASRLLDLTLRVLSLRVTADDEPEKVYQAFALGLLVKLLSRYEVDSDRESALGLYDIMVLPREAGQPGAVLEFKVVGSASAKAVRGALREALAQIEEKGYTERLRERGADPILRYGVACHGKQVWVQQAGASQIHGAPLAETPSPRRPVKQRPAGTKRKPR